MTTEYLVATTRVEESRLMCTDKQVDFSLLISSSLTAEDLEDALDIITGLRTEKLYRQQGRSAFVPLEAHKRRRRRGSV